MRARQIVVTHEGRRRHLGAMRGHAAEVHRMFLDRINPEGREITHATLSRVIDGLASDA